VFLPGLSSLAFLAEAAASISEARTSNADLGGIIAIPLESWDLVRREVGIFRFSGRKVGIFDRKVELDEVVDERA
jgi:hypothetical protein